jgi:thiamine biosynthesis lipoprotein ApbE
MELPAWEWHAMGTTWRIFHGGQAVQEDADAVVALVAADEARWSRFLAGSELSRLNAADGTPLRVTPETLELLAACDRWHEATDGAFSPLVGTAMVAWGYSASRDRQALGAERSPGPIAVARDHVVFDSERCLARVPRGALLDLGGIAKMWSAARAARVLAERCDDPHLLVEAGGDMVAARGDHTVAVEAPGDHAIVVREGQGIATSGWSRRHWSNGDGGQAHHLIDPSTGAPGPRVQATVRANDPIEAEIEAKVLALRPHGLTATRNAALLWQGERVLANTAWKAAA